VNEIDFIELELEAPVLHKREEKKHTSTNASKKEMKEGRKEGRKDDFIHN